MRITLRASWTHSLKEKISFHMPGHILGKGLAQELKTAGSLDITEIPGSDCLHAPEGVIRESQELAAKCFGADYSLFLVNGSTSGIHAMIQASVKPGGKLIIGRDSHRSVLNALALIDAEPVFVMPQMDAINQIPLGVTAEAIEEAVIANPDAQGILITRPNYYGIASKIEEIADVAKRYRIPLMIDEAHGAHFRFHRMFPKPALDGGADLCVQSLHKTLPALTQTALLHGNRNCLLDRKVVEMTASMVQTTSPSYLLMASIDIARGFMENKGEELYEVLRICLNNFDGELEKRTVIRRTALKYENFETDFSRIVLSFDKTSLTGISASQLLQERFGIVAEMADLRHVVLIATPFHNSSDFERLLSALEKLSCEYQANDPARIDKRRTEWPWTLPERVMPLRQALFERKCEVPINEAEGAISALPVIPYPPGIPVLNPGERITGSILEYIEAVLASGSSVHGIIGGKVQIIDTND
jgi:arginine/lysine/ornithine decarboxylase